MSFLERILRRDIFILSFTGLMACGGSEVQGAGSSSNLPCDVERIVAQHCEGCHGTHASFGAPMSLTALSDFHALASDKEHEVYETVSDHVHGTTTLMPPPP